MLNGSIPNDIIKNAISQIHPDGSLIDFFG
jgi:hypothetical protein